MNRPSPDEFEETTDYDDAFNQWVSYVDYKRDEARDDCIGEFINDINDTTRD